MIRYVKQLVLLCAFLALAVSFTACKEEVKNHVCGSWTVVKEPTCLEKGKDGDVVIWNADPLTTVDACAFVTVVDGRVAVEPVDVEYPLRVGLPV